MKNKNRNLLETAARIINPKDKIPMSSFILLIGMLVLFLSVLGIRDVIITPMLVSLTGDVTIRLWIPIIYWIGIVLSVGMILAYVINNPPKIDSEDIIDGGIYLLLSLPFLYLLLTQRLFLDFWLDELMSIVRHIKPSVSEAVLSYPAPNNHIFSNFVSAIYVQIIGRQELNEILAKPFLLRLPYMLAGLSTILVSGFGAKKLINRTSGYIAVILLCTTIPYLNFVVQVRGYSFSVLFFSLIILLSLDYRKYPTRRKAAGIVIFTCLLIYTIPSNIYAILAIMFYYFAVIICQYFSKRQILHSKHVRELIYKDLSVLSLLFGGVFLSVLLYLPLIPKMMGDSYMESSGLFSGNVFQDTFQQTILHLISNRWVIMIPAVIGIILYAVKFLEKKNRISNRVLGIALASMTIPFVASFSRGDHPFERVFLVLLPAFVLLMSLGISEIYTFLRDKLSQLSISPGSIVVVVFFVSNLVFFQTFNHNRGQIKQNLEDQQFDYVQYSDNRMWASHFLDYYQVLPLISVIEKESSPDNIYLDNDNIRYEWVVTTYLDAFGINFRNFSEIDDFAKQDYIVVTSYPDTSIAKTQYFYPDSECELISPALSIYQAWICAINPD